jgi:hypothetical protein
MHAGDTLTVPVDLARRYHSSVGAVMFAVRGTDAPAAPEWAD